MSTSELKSKDILLLGCGDIGSRLGLQLLAAGHRPLAVRRNVQALPPALPALSLDYCDAAQLTALQSLPLATLVLTLTPAGRDAAGYRRGFLEPVQNLLALFAQGPRREIIFVSSTRVYGNSDGGWVDELTPPAPSDAQGEIIAAAERLLLDSRHRVTVVRCAGIYGRQPARLLERLQRGEICAAQPPRYSNRIHRDDCVGFLLHLLSVPQWQPVYLASDGNPVAQREVEEWLLQALKVVVSRELPAVAGMNRRCSNRALLASGYRLQYPDFRSGYSAMITSTSMLTALGRAAT